MRLQSPFGLKFGLRSGPNHSEAMRSTFMNRQANP